MVFNSFVYVIFFSIVFIMHWIMPKKYQWIWLLLASCFFYLNYGVVFFAILSFFIIGTYISAIWIERMEAVRKKRVLVITLCTMILTLILFKYLGFLDSIYLYISGNEASIISTYAARLIIPVGLSFFTFQMMGYIIDVFRGRINAEKNIGYYALFAMFFPQITSGPIGRADQLMPQLFSERKFDLEQITKGAILILWGFFKKLVVADMLVLYVNNIFDNPYSFVGGSLLIAAIFFSIQIYCDFSGYSDIAIGCSKMLGIDLMENFRSPYMSSSIKEFWSRWHISLSTWFRDYLYIPLGGNRCSSLKRDFNLMVTFLVSGLWHGANMTYIVWGGIHGIGQVVENHFYSTIPKIKLNIILSMIIKLIKMFMVFVFSTLAWVFFRAKTVGDGAYIIGHMLDGIDNPGTYIRRGIGEVGISGNIRLAYVVLILIVLFITDIVNYKGTLIDRIYKLPIWLRFAICVCFATFTVIFAQKGVAAEFVYIKF